MSLSNNLLMRKFNGCDFGVFDIESSSIKKGNQDYGLGSFLIGEEFVFCDKPENLIECFISWGDEGKTVFYAHYLNYDIRFLFDLLNKHYRLDFIFSHSKLIKLVARDKRTNLKLFELRDSYALLPYSLDYLSKTFNVEYKKKKINFDMEEFNKDNIEHREYAKFDCLSLRDILNKFFKMYGIDKKKLTISSIAFDYWKKYYSNNGDIYSYRSSYPDLRKSYYGGRVEVFNHYLEHGYCYDVNSMYPFVMKFRNYPIGHYMEYPIIVRELNLILID